MEVKNIHMTDEYAAHYLLKQGYLAGRIEALQARVYELERYNTHQVLLSDVHATYEAYYQLQGQ